MLSANGSAQLDLLTGLPSGNFTFSGWLRVEAPTICVVAGIGAGSGFLFFYIDSGGDLRVSTLSGDVLVTASPEPWAQFGFIRSGSSFESYYRPNNASSWTLVQTDASFGAAAIDRFDLWHDAGIYQGNGFTCADWRLWSAAKTTTELSTEGRSRHAVSAAGLVSDWPLETDLTAQNSGGVNITLSTGTYITVKPNILTLSNSMGRGHLTGSVGDVGTDPTYSVYGLTQSSGLIATWGSLYDVPVAYAISGQQTAEIVTNLSTIIAAEPPSPHDIVLIYEITNSAYAGGQTGAQIEDSYETIALAFRGYGASIIAMGAIPLASGFGGGGVNTAILASNAAIEAAYAAYATEFWDVYGDNPQFDPIGVTPNPTEYFDDFGHLSDSSTAGYGRLLNYVNGKITALRAGAAPAPVLSSTTPANSATGVSTTTTIALDFDVSVEATAGDIELWNIIAPTSPAAPTVNTDAQNTNATSFVVDVPAVSAPAAGTSTVVLIGLTKDGSAAWTGTWPPTGWTIGRAQAGSTNVYHAIIWRRYTASAAATTFTLTQASENALSRAIVVTGAHLTTDPEFGTPATATSTAPNPPSLTPSWGSEPSASGYHVSIDGNITSYTHPTGWTANGQGNTTTDGTTGNRVGQASSYNTGTTGAQDPGALTTTSGRWVATTWSVRPADANVLLETIPSNDSQVVIAADVATITPGAALPASSLIEIRVDSGAFEALGGSLPFAGIAAGAYRFTTGAGGGTVSAAAVSSAEAFGAPQIEPGAVSVVAGAVGSVEAFGGSTVQPGAVQLAPSGLSSGEAFGATTVVTGAVSVVVSDIASSEAFGAALVSAGGSSVVTSGIATAETFGAPAVNVGTVSVTAQAIDSTEAFGGHSLQTGAANVSPGSIVSQEAFGGAVVSAGGSTVVVAGIASGEAAGVPAVQPGPVSVSASGIVSAEAFGSAALGLRVTLGGLASAEAFGAPELQQQAAQVGPLGIPSAEAIGLQSVELELQYIGLTGILSAESFGVAALQSIGLSFDPGRSVSIGAPRTVQRLGVPRLTIRIGKN